MKKWNIKNCAFSGGHSYTCTNIKQDSVHIDMRGMDSIQLTQVGDCLRGQDITPTANSTIILILRESTILTFSQRSPIATTILGQQQSHRSGSHPGARSYMGKCKKVTIVLMLITLVNGKCNLQIRWSMSRGFWDCIFLWQVLRAIPTDRYSYPHGQCRRLPDIILIHHLDKDRQRSRQR